MRRENSIPTGNLTNHSLVGVRLLYAVLHRAYFQNATWQEKEKALNPRTGPEVPSLSSGGTKDTGHSENRQRSPLRNDL